MLHTIRCGQEQCHRRTSIFEVWIRFFRRFFRACSGRFVVFTKNKRRFDHPKSRYPRREHIYMRVFFFFNVFVDEFRYAPRNARDSGTPRDRVRGYTIQVQRYYIIIRISYTCACFFFFKRDIILAGPENTAVRRNFLISSGACCATSAVARRRTSRRYDRVVIPRRYLLYPSGI